MRARIARLALGGLVAVTVEASALTRDPLSAIGPLVLHEGRPGGLWSDPFEIDAIVPVAKVCLPGRTEAVVIIHGTPNVDVEAKLPSQFVSVGPNVNYLRTTLHHRCVRREGVFPFRILRDEQLVSWPPVVFVDLKLDGPPDVSRGQSARVANRDIRDAAFAGGRGDDSARLNAYVGSLQNSGVVTLFLANPNESQGHDNEQASEGGNPKSKEVGWSAGHPKGLWVGHGAAFAAGGLLGLIYLCVLGLFSRKR